MPLSVVSVAAYCTSPDNWSKGDYDVRDFVKALKGQAVNEYAWVKVRGQLKRFDNSSRNEVLRWFSQMAGDYLREHGPAAPCALVPVPSSSADLTSRDAGATARMARAIAFEMGGGFTVRDVLRFRRPMVPSHLGGSRDVQTILERLAQLAPVNFREVVLVDDAVVTGAHLRACAWKLAEHGDSHVGLAICGASAERLPVAEPFGIHERMLLGVEGWSRQAEGSPIDSDRMSA
jgi:predicted amidophosphoribosyltransferase